MRTPSVPLSVSFSQPVIYLKTNQQQTRLTLSFNALRHELRICKRLIAAKDRTFLGRNSTFTIALFAPDYVL